MSTPPNVSTVVRSAAPTAAASVTSATRARPVSRRREIEARNRSACRRERLRGRAPDSRRRARDERDHAAQRRWRRRRPQLRLLELPVLDVEQPLGRERDVAAELVLGRLEHRDRVVVDLRGDLRFPEGRARGEHAERRIEDDSWRGIEHRQGLVGMPGEIVGVLACERGDVPSDERRALRSDDVLRRQRPARRERREIAARDEAAYVRVGVPLHDHRASRCIGDRAPQVSEIGEWHVRQPGWIRRGASRHPLTRDADQLEVLLVCLARGRAEGEEPVVEEHHADGVLARLLGPEPPHLAREVEPGHDVGDDDDGVAEHLAYEPFAVGGVRERDDRVGVRVQHRRVRQERMQQRLDRRLRRRRIEPCRRQLANHLRVAESLELEQLAQPLEAQRREAVGRDRRHVASGPLHVDRVDLAPGDVLPRRLHRRVAASVEHERRVRAEPLRRLHALLEIARGPVHVRVL